MTFMQPRDPPNLAARWQESPMTMFMCNINTVSLMTRREVLITTYKGTLPRPSPEECVSACRLLECLVQTVSLIDHFLLHALLSSLHLQASLPAAKWQHLPGRVCPLFMMCHWCDCVEWSSAGVISVDTECVS